MDKDENYKALVKAYLNTEFPFSYTQDVFIGSP